MGPKYHPVYEEDKMKTIRLLYPDYISGGLDTYYFGAKLLQHILPQNENRPLIEVDILPPDGEEKPVDHEKAKEKVEKKGNHLSHASLCRASRAVVNSRVVRRQTC